MAPNRLPNASERHKRQWKCSRCGEWTWLDKDRCHDCKGQRTKVECKAGNAAAQSGKPVRTGLGVGACGGERPQVDTSSGFVQAGRTRTERRAATRAAKQMEKDLAELRERRAKDKSAEVSPQSDAVGNSAADGSAGEVSAINNKIKLAEKAVKHLKDTEAEVREYLYGSKEAFDQALAKAVADLERAHAEKRGRRTLHEQKASAEARLKRLQGKMAEAGVRSSKLQLQKEELDKQIAEELEQTTKLQSEVDNAKTDVLALSEKVAEELRGSGAGAAASLPGSTSEATAAAVKGYLQGLPQVVSGDPEGQQAIQQVLSLLGKLDEAAKTVASAASAEAENASEMEQDIDDDQAEQLAEVVTEAIQDEEDEVRAVRVAAAKVRLKGQGQVVFGIVAKKAKLKK